MRHLDSGLRENDEVSWSASAGVRLVCRWRRPGLRSLLVAVVGLVPFGCAHSAGSPAAPVQLRVMVYNIHAGKDAAAEPNLDRVATLITGTETDLALLQEVDRGTERSGGEDQPATLATATGMEAVFGRTLDYQGGEYGIAILSGAPLVDLGVRSMQVDPPQERAGGSYEPRGMLIATVQTPAGPVHLINTHLDAGRDDHYRRQEIEQVIALADSLQRSGGSVLVGGDLNAEPGSAVIDRLVRAGWRDVWAECGTGDGLTFPAEGPLKRIDYLFMSGDLRCVSAEVLETTTSDHRPLLAVIEKSPT